MAEKKATGHLSQAGRELGKKGGPARASVLTPERRKEIARQGGRAKAAGKKGK